MLQTPNRQILSEIIDKKTLGATQGGLISVAFHEKGPEATRQVFTGIQVIANYWLLHNGFSIRIGDPIVGPKFRSYITDKIAEKRQKVHEIIKDTHHDRLRAMPGMTIREPFESMVERELNHVRDDPEQYTQKNLKEDNNMKNMATAGSKCSYINVSQMSACVRQQSVEGTRIPLGFCHRTLPHFSKDNFSLEAWGVHEELVFARIYTSGVLFPYYGWTGGSH